MTLLELWGWACAAAGSMLAVPQFVRVLRAGTTAGLSLVLWQFSVAASIGWTVHGWRGGWWNMVAPNLISGILALLVLRLIRENRRLPLLRTYALGLTVGAVCVAFDVLLGPAAFGLAVLVPLLIGQLDQLRALLFDPDVTGVSFAFLVITLVLQGMWGSWAVWAGDTSAMITASAMSVGAVLNVVWFLLRRSGRIGPRLWRRARQHQA